MAPAPDVAPDGPREWVPVAEVIGALAHLGPLDGEDLRRELDEHFVTEVEDPYERGRGHVTVSIGVGLPVRLEDLPRDETAPRMELVDGSLLVTPMAGPVHQHVVGGLYAQLSDGVPSGWVVLPGANVVRRGSTDRLLIPDVVVAEAHVLTDDSPYLDPSDVLLAVEVESPSTRSTDRLLKRELYAQWRIAHYWIADPVARTLTRLTLTPERVYEPGTGVAAWLERVDPTTLWVPAVPPG